MALAWEQVLELVRAQAQEQELELELELVRELELVPHIQQQ